MNEPRNDSGMIDRVKARLQEPDQRASTIAVLCLALIPLAILAYVLVVLSLTPRTEGLSRSAFEQSTVIYTRNGSEITRFYDKNRRWLPVDSMANTVPRALVATEDRRFYDHKGVDVMRTIGAVFQTVGGNTQGGSTITMQLVRNLYPDVSDDWDITRKIKEWIAAMRMEDNYSKEQILEFYLNTVPFGYNSFGVEAAAQTYFNEPALELDTLQSATLVGMLKGTTMYNPVRNPERSRERRNVVLQELAEAGYLSQAEYERLRDQETEMDFNPITHTQNFAPYFAEHVRQWMSDWADQNGYNLYTDGLEVYTTLDSTMQQAAESAVTEQLDLLQNVVDVSWSQASVPFYSTNASAYEGRAGANRFAYFWESNPQLLDRFIRQTDTYRERVNAGASEDEALSALRDNQAFVDSVKSMYSRLQGGFVAMQPQNGMIRAWVGGRDYETSMYDHVAQARRQPGSTFKPFVYATALDNGYQQNDLFRDTEIEYRDPYSGDVWSPSNFGGETGEPIPLRDALAYSKNTVTSQLAVDLGPSRIADMARRMGIQSELDEVPSLALGTSPVTLLEMVTAYATLADQGRRHKPVFITRIEDKDGNVVATIEPETQRAVSPSTAYGTLDMMRGVVDHGTGVRMQAQYGARGDLAAKTGTTQDNADGWFLLIHPELVMGAWVGFESPEVAFRTRYWGQGSHNALRIVGSFYQDMQLSTDARFQEPASYVEPDSSSTLRIFAGNSLEAENRSTPDTLGIEVPEPDVDTDFDFESEDLDGDQPATVNQEEDDVEAPDETVGEQPSTPSEEAPTPSEETPSDEIEEPEPEDEADQRTREARENSQVRDLLDRMGDDDEN